MQEEDDRCELWCSPSHPPRFPYLTHAADDAAEVVCAVRFSLSVLHQTLVQQGSDGLLVEMLTDEDNLLHAVSVALVPVLAQACILGKHGIKLRFGHSGIPLAGILQAYLLACLFEYIAHIFLAHEVAEALCADDIGRPQTRHEVEEAVQAKPFVVVFVFCVFF